MIRDVLGTPYCRSRAQCSAALTRGDSIREAHEPAVLTLSGPLCFHCATLIFRLLSRVENVQEDLTGSKEQKLRFNLGNASLYPHPALQIATTFQFPVPVHLEAPIMRGCISTLRM
jgi:hypothetical protein